MTFLASSLSSISNTKSNSMVIPVLLWSVGVAAAASATTIAATKIKMFQTRGNNDSDIEEDDLHHSVKIALPEWAKKELSTYSKKTYHTDEEMMDLAIHLSSRNVEEGTGGPFGTAIFERNLDDDTAKLISVGVNRVVPLGNSTLHGEMVAIQLAQAKLKSFTMQLPTCKPVEDAANSNSSSPLKKTRQFELFTSCEPCAMCLGATLWSGVSRIVCGATKKDAEAIGFDEGPVFDESYEHLKKARIGVKKSVLQPKAAKVLQNYGKIGLIYN